MRRVLVVANRSLGGDHLLQAIKARVADGPCEFTLVVPAKWATVRGNANPSAGGTPWRGAARQAGDFLLPERGPTRAHQNLELGLERFRSVGATVDGAVDDSNVLDAISGALHRAKFDEVIISTVPKGLSRWVHQDLPHRVKRRFGLPVTVITPPKP